MNASLPRRLPRCPDLRAVPIALLLAVAANPAPAQVQAHFSPDKMDTFLYGAAFYEEYMPVDRLDQDVELMQQAGINVVRVGESTWSLWEPEDGHFEFAWMDRIIDRLARAHIRVIMGTPTYSIPPWMFKEHPEILVTRLDGQRATYGIRQNMDITNPDFLRYAERVIRQIAAHYRDNPAIIGYQIDNETTSYGTAGPNVQAGFVRYLQDKFSSVERLNKIWGLVYWGQSLHDWSELPPRNGILNPGWKLEWDRYQDSLATRYLAWQAALVREYLRPDQFVMQDFGGATRSDVNEYAISKSLDIAGINPYHPTQDLYDGEGSSYGGDFARSLKGANYLVTEINAQTIGWDSRTQFPPYDGQLRQDVYLMASTGANMVEYWHWHSLHYGQETYWKGVLSHDLEPGRIYAEVSRTAHELQRVGSRIVDFKPAHPVALLYSNDSRRGIEYMPFLVSQPAGDMPWSHPAGYDLEMRRLYRALYRWNVGVDFVFPETEDLSAYRVVVVPPLYVASDALLTRLVDYVRGGGHLVLTLKSGFCDEYSTVRHVMAPGPLREAAGFHYQEFSNLEKPLPLRGDPFRAGPENRVSDWAEMLLPDHAKALAYYDHPFFGKYPALTENHFGKGMVTYEGTVLSDELQHKVLERVLQQAQLMGPDQKLPAAVRVKHGASRAGNPMHYYFNFSAVSQQIVYTYAAGRELLANRALAKGGALTLEPWGVAIIEQDRP
ncbi:MAG TPA: beta-galactosidase [Bryobacteraceae bacterium]|nr:beta-galactosidase [Bryobacteraceae bacterium]